MARKSQSLKITTNKCLWGSRSCSHIALFVSVWRHVDKGTSEGAVDAMLIHGQGKENTWVLCWGWWLPSYIGSQPCVRPGAELARTYCLIDLCWVHVPCLSSLHFLGRCHHCVQCWTYSALLGDQHWRVELGDIPGHGQVGFPVCNAALEGKKGLLTLSGLALWRKMG